MRQRMLVRGRTRRTFMRNQRNHQHVMLLGTDPCAYPAGGVAESVGVWPAGADSISA
jgi:hypothetical protein